MLRNGSPWSSRLGFRCAIACSLCQAIAQVRALEARDSALAHFGDRIRGRGLGILLVERKKRHLQSIVRIQPGICGQHLVDHLVTDNLGRRDPKISGDAQLTERDLGALSRWDLRRRVERDGVPNDFDMLLAHPALGEKLFGEICALDFESNDYRRDLRQAEIMEYRRYTEHFAIVLHAPFLSDRVGEERRAHDVMKQEGV